MKKKKTFFVSWVIIFLLVTFWGTAKIAINNPVAVSPGSETELVTVWQSCPTFSWSSVDQAASYKIAIFESVDGKIMPYENMAAMSAPMISQQIPGPALSWTPSTKESLKTGTMYAWYVHAVDASGNEIGPWSMGKFFKVEQELRFAGIVEKLAEKMKEYGVNDETITNVLNDISSEVKEVVVPTGWSNNPPEANKIQGVEGTNKTLFGLFAGTCITTGCDNTFIGHRAGFCHNTGSFNSFLGHYAGNFNTSGSYNTFLGYYAGYGNTSASYNTFVGNSAGRNSTTGSRNAFFGYFSGSANTTGYDDTFMGYYSGLFNTTGFFDTFVGAHAGRLNTTGSRNSFFGTYAGYGNTSGYDDTYLGYNAGFNNTNGYYNTFVGNYAGNQNSSGSFDAFFGFKSGYSNTTGVSNSYFGLFSGYSNTTGSCNTFVGRSAGYSNTGGSGNVFLGCNAGFNEMGSNKLYIANSNTILPLVFGDFAKQLFTVNGNLGIGINAAPDHPIDVSNGAYLSSGGVWTDASSRSLKENIENLSISEAVTALTDLTPVKYNYKTNKMDKHVGFIAEDVPELVASANRKGLSPMDVTAVLTKVVQELQKENQEYKKIISSLQERVATLEKK